MKKSHKIFKTIDNFIAFIFRKIGMKKIGIIVDFNQDKNYWNTISMRWKMIFYFVPILYLIVYLNNTFLRDTVSVGSILWFISDVVVKIIFFSFLLSTISSFIVLKKFDDGIEQQGGNYEIQWIHLYYMFILPLLFCVAISIPLWK